MDRWFDLGEGYGQAALAGVNSYLTTKEKTKEEAAKKYDFLTQRAKLKASAGDFDGAHADLQEADNHAAQFFGKELKPLTLESSFKAAPREGVPGVTRGPFAWGLAGQKLESPEPLDSYGPQSTPERPKVEYGPLPSDAKLGGATLGGKRYGAYTQGPDVETPNDMSLLQNKRTVARYLGLPASPQVQMEKMDPYANYLVTESDPITGQSSRMAIPGAEKPRTPSRPVTVAPGGVVFDAETGRPIAKSPYPPNKPQGPHPQQIVDMPMAGNTVQRMQWNAQLGKYVPLGVPFSRGSAGSRNPYRERELHLDGGKLQRQSLNYQTGQWENIGVPYPRSASFENEKQPKKPVYKDFVSAARTLVGGEPHLGLAQSPDDPAFLQLHRQWEGRVKAKADELYGAQLAEYESQLRAWKERHGKDAGDPAGSEAQGQANDAPLTAKDIADAFRAAKEAEMAPLRAKKKVVPRGGGASSGGAGGAGMPAVPPAGGSYSRRHPPAIRHNADAAISQLMKAFPGVTIFSGQRDTETQRYLWNNALAKYGSPEAARAWVAPPGNSFHERGTAYDLRFGGQGRKPTAEDFAIFGFYQRPGMTHEAWHWEFSPELYVRNRGRRSEYLGVK